MEKSKHASTRHMSMFNTCSLYLFLNIFHPPKFPVHGSFHGFTALPQKSYHLAVGFCHLKFSEGLSKGEQDTLQSSLPLWKGRASKSKRRGNCLFIVTGESWGSGSTTSTANPACSSRLGGQGLRGGLALYLVCVERHLQNPYASSSLGDGCTVRSMGNIPRSQSELSQLYRLFLVQRSAT